MFQSERAQGCCRKECSILTADGARGDTYLPQDRKITLADSWKEGQNESEEKECRESREQDFNPITSPIEGRQEEESE